MDDFSAEQLAALRQVADERIEQNRINAELAKEHEAKTLAREAKERAELQIQALNAELAKEHEAKTLAREAKERAELQDELRWFFGRQMVMGWEWSPEAKAKHEAEEYQKLEQQQARRREMEGSWGPNCKNYKGAGGEGRPAFTV